MDANATREHNFFCTDRQGLLDLVADKAVLDSQKPYIIMKEDGQIGGLFRLSDLIHFHEDELARKSGSLDDIAPLSLSFIVFRDILRFRDLLTGDEEFAIYVNEDGDPLDIFDNLSFRRQVLQSFGDQNNIFYRVIEHLNEEIFICDKKGYIIYVNPASEKLNEYKAEDILGKYVGVLADDKVFSISSTLEVIRTGKRVNLMQKLQSGKNLLTMSIPVCDEQGDLEFVISSAWDVQEMNQILDRLEQQDLELAQKNEELDMLRNEIFLEENFLCSGRAMLKIRDTIMKVAPIDMTILVEGETGVGKEAVTRMIHRFSGRSRQPFVKINCGMIPENLLESELFGYEEGSFTGAKKGGKVGKVELAHRGTLFFDEIGELPLSMQVKLLEFLQDRVITRVGGSEKIYVDTRVIAATNRDLRDMCRDGQFRQDLYYRLNVVPLKIPSLRDRVDEIENLAKYFLHQYNKKYRLNKTFDSDILQVLLSYDWPGNIRELEHMIERLYIISDSPLLCGGDLDKLLFGSEAGPNKVFCAEIMPLKEAKWEVERQLVERAYLMYGSTYKAAKALSVDQSTVVKLMKKYKGRSKEIEMSSEKGDE